MITLERGRLSWFRYPTHNVGTYLGRGALGLIFAKEIISNPISSLAVRNRSDPLNRHLLYKLIPIQSLGYHFDSEEKTRALKLTFAVKINSNPKILSHCG